MNNKKIAEKYYQKYLKFVESIIGNQTTYNDELMEIGKELFGDKFIGVYASDQIPKLKSGEMVICNLDSSNEPGSHWVSLFKSGNNIFIYDSFGRCTYKILPELKQSGNGMVKMTEKDVEQKDDEYNCGARCIACLMVFNNHGIKYAKWI